MIPGRPGSDFPAAPPLHTIYHAPGYPRKALISREESARRRSMPGKCHSPALIGQSATKRRPSWPSPSATIMMARWLASAGTRGRSYHDRDEGDQHVGQMVGQAGRTGGAWRHARPSSGAGPGAGTDRSPLPRSPRTVTRMRPTARCDSLVSPGSGCRTVRPRTPRVRAIPCTPLEHRAVWRRALDRTRPAHWRPVGTRCRRAGLQPGCTARPPVPGGSS